jgi:aldehyde:ferredoxin oxidoreductase
MAEGFFRAAAKWGRLEGDLKSGLLEYPHWGLPNHYDPRAEIEWGYGSILGDRDINEHDLNPLFWMPSTALWQGEEPPLSAKEVTKIFSEKLMPYEGEPSMLDFSTENMYSEHMVKLVAWHRHYTRFWKQSALFCDLRFPDFFNMNVPDKRGITGEGEQRFLNAVTGKNYSFVDGIELGRKIWNLDNAIWTLQGRHRDMVHFADYIYKVPFAGFGSFAIWYMPGIKNGEWSYIPLDGRHIDREQFEKWKTKFYIFEGWDSRTGWPTRRTMESLGMGNVANELEEKGMLGSS